jgi:glycosyltransferase involved in cell wall biosynthesis
MTSVSVIVPVWNRARSVPAAIDSVLAQQLPAGWSIEMIVVDDGSTDDLVGALRPYGSGVTCVRRERNGGAAAARNTGLGAARGDYVAFLDSDDVWLPGKLTAQIDAMRKNNWRASCTAYYLSRPGRPEIVSPLYQTGPIGLADMVWGCFVSPGSTLMFERGVFDEIGAFDRRIPRQAGCQDRGNARASLDEASGRSRRARPQALCGGIGPAARGRTLLSRQHASVARGAAEVVPAVAEPAHCALGRDAQLAGAPLRCAASRVCGNWPGRATSPRNRAR